MGCFSLRCAISGLPVTPSHRVMVLFLQQRDLFYNESACYVDDLWSVRSLPFEARYNDYGSIESWEVSDITKIFEQYINRDGIEMETRNPEMTPKNRKSPFTLGEVADLCASGDMFVDKIADSRGKKKFSSPLFPDMTPDKEEIEDLLGSEAKNWNVIQHDGWCVLQSPQNINSDSKEQAIKILNTKYSAIETASSSFDCIEIRVFTAPGKNSTGDALVDHEFSTQSPLTAYRAVRLCLILKDVWDYALTIDGNHTYVEYTLEQRKESLRKRMDKQYIILALQTAKDSAWRDEMYAESDNRDFSIYRLEHGPRRGANDWTQQYRDFESKGTVTPDIIKSAAELMHVMEYMMSIRMCIAPSDCLGDQCGAIDAHIKLAEFTLSWAKKVKEDQDA